MSFSRRRKPSIRLANSVLAVAPKLKSTRRPELRLARLGCLDTFGYVGVTCLPPKLNSRKYSNRLPIIISCACSAKGILLRPGGGYVEPLDDNLKQLMKELGAAINDTLSNSDRISEAIAKIRSSGYDVFLVLEATIGFNRRHETADESTEAGGFDGEAELNITSQDVKFLKSLKISIDDRETN